MNHPYRVYMDLDVINNDYGSVSRPQLRLEETRNTPLLSGDSSDYFYFVLRGQLHLMVLENNLPKFSKTVDEGTFFGLKEIQN